MTLYDELDAIIDSVDNDRPIVIREKLRNIRDKLPDEIDEITVITTNNAVSDVLVNGKPTTYCVVPKDQAEEYLKKRF